MLETIDKAIVTAMKERDQERLGALRMVKSALKLQQIEDKGTLSDEAAVKVLQKLVKQRKDSIEQFDKAGRKDLADKERTELAIIETYLPKAPDEAEIKGIVDEVVKETGASSPKDMGNVMKAVMARLAGRGADGKIVSSLVKQALGA
jgi:uncharacterized protein YqeY